MPIKPTRWLAKTSITCNDSQFSSQAVNNGLGYLWNAFKAGNNRRKKQYLIPIEKAKIFDKEKRNRRTRSERKLKSIK